MGSLVGETWSAFAQDGRYHTVGHVDAPLNYSEVNHAECKIRKKGVNMLRF